jgi:hypothetical protein
MKGVPCKRKEPATAALLCLTMAFNLKKVQYTEDGGKLGSSLRAGQNQSRPSRL